MKKIYNKFLKFITPSKPKEGDERISWVGCVAFKQKYINNKWINICETTNK